MIKSNMLHSKTSRIWIQVLQKFRVINSYHRPKSKILKNRSRKLKNRKILQLLKRTQFIGFLNSFLPKKTISNLLILSKLHMNLLKKRMLNLRRLPTRESDIIMPFKMLQRKTTSSSVATSIASNQASLPTLSKDMLS